jgi:hypothetical protein
MGTPGFTAEVTEYRTENSYASGLRAADTTRVLPQQIRGGYEREGYDGDPCRGACRCCGFYGYQGCCSVCDECFVRS